MSEVATLGLPDFNKPFTLETDASVNGIRVVLVQQGRPLAFLSHALAPMHLGLSIYEKELLEILVVVDKWRYYLEGGKFVIKTDHECEIFATAKVAYTIATEGNDKVNRIGLCNSV